MTIETRPFDPGGYLDSPEAMLAYLGAPSLAATCGRSRTRLAWSLAPTV